MILLLSIHLITTAQDTTALLLEKTLERQEYINSLREGYNKRVSVNLFNKLNTLKQQVELLDSYRWHPLGPLKKDSISKNEYDGNGRINVIKYSPENPQILYVGSASGGIWKSTNSGNTWELLEMTAFMSIAISDIEISPLKPNIIYASTGDFPNQVGHGFSIGIIKSTDAGKSWRALNNNILLSDSLFINEMVIDPIDPNFLTAATSQGIIRTTDGGESWTKLWGDKTTNVRDLELQPSNPFKIYASTFSWSGKTEIIYSEDDGKNWQSLKEFDNICRTELAVTHANPNLLYILSANNYNLSGENLEIYNDLTHEFTKLNLLDNEQKNIVLRQGHYNLLLEVNPKDENEIFAGGVYLYHTINQGKKWNKIKNIHSDQHDLLFSPNGYRYSANDGGIYKYKKNILPWTDINNGLNITQFYRLSTHPINPNVTYSGSQDNGMKIFLNNNWEQLHTADGMESAIDVGNSNIVYTSTQKGDVYRSDFNGYYPFENISYNISNQERPWLTEFATHPTLGGNISLGFKDLYHSTNYGKTWIQITNFNEKLEEVSFISALLIDTSMTYFGNKKYLFSFNQSTKTIDTLAEVENKITSITKHSRELYFSLGGYNKIKKVFKIEDNTITNITANLPNISVHCLKYITDKGILIAGTDIGVFSYDGKSWTKFGIGLPNVVVTDIAYNPNFNHINISTFGNGLWSLELSSSDIQEPILSDKSDIELCHGEIHEIKIKNYDSKLEYIWQDGSKDSSIYVEKEGLYFVTAFDKSENIYTSSKVLKCSYHTAPQVKMYLESRNDICQGQPCVLRCEVSNYELSDCNILWSNGDTTQRVYIFEPGIYYAKVENIFGCVGVSDSIEVIVYEQPQKPEISRDGNFLKSSEADRYQWYYNGKKIKDAVGQTYYATKLGNYFVKVRNKNDCSNVSAEYSIVAPQNNIRVFPNPTKDFVIIEGVTSNNTTVEIKIYDISGKKCFEKEYGNIENFFSKKIWLDNFTIGTYLISVKCEGRTYNKKIKKY